MFTQLENRNVCICLLVCESGKGFAEKQTREGMYEIRFVISGIAGEFSFLLNIFLCFANFPW